MTFRLRPRREPCLRSPRGALLAVVGAVAMTTAPAAAAAAEPEFLKPLGWYPEEAGLRSAVPASVEFKDVAAAPAAVVAVGVDTATGEPVIYSRDSAGWHGAPVEVPLAAPGELVDVALGGLGEVAWAVGTAGGQPVVLELAPGVWKDRSAAAAIPATTPPTAVAMNGDGAIIGDSGGSLHWVQAGGAKTDTKSLTGAGAINGIARFSSSPGLAVADYKYLAGEQTDNGIRIYDLRDPPLLDADEQADQPDVDMTGLAAAEPNSAVAIDSRDTTWRLTRSLGQNDWVPESQVSGNLAAVASVDGGPSPRDGAGWATEFLAGEAAAAGSIWQRTRWTTNAAAWNSDPLPAGTSPLTGIAATGWDAAWAVGESGTILRYWRPPDPEAEAAWRAQQQQQQPPPPQQPQQGTQSPTTEQPQQQQTTTISLKQWDPSDSQALDPGEERVLTNGVVVTDGDSTVPKRRRLVKNVKAIFRRTLSGRRKLIVLFRLTRRANVRVSAKRGRRVIARTPLRTMRRGRRKVVLPIRGKTPPSSLKIVARPIRKAT
jgi:hypothetical protein